MRQILITSIVGGCFSFPASGSRLCADTVVDAKLGLTLKLSSEFAPRPDLVGATPDIIHAFQYGEATEDQFVPEASEEQNIGW